MSFAVEETPGSNLGLGGSPSFQKRDVFRVHGHGMVVTELHKLPASQVKLRRHRYEGPS